MNIKNLFKNVLQKIKEVEYRFGLIADYVVENGTSGSWKYRHWESGKSEAWYADKIAQKQNNAWGTLYFNGSTTDVSIPSGIFNASPLYFPFVGNASFMMGATAYGEDSGATVVKFYVWNSKQVSYSIDVLVRVYCIGTWK